MTRFWPGTNILKSNNNDFNWKERSPQTKNENARYRIEANVQRGGPYYITPTEKPYQKTFK